MTRGVYTIPELLALGIKEVGTNVSISRRASIYVPHNISLGSNVRVDDYCVLTGSKYLRIGDHVHIAHGSHLMGGAGISIGDFSNICAGSKVISQSDDFSGDYLIGPTVPRQYRKVLSLPIIMEDHVIIGTNSIILPGVTMHLGSGTVPYTLVHKDTDAMYLYTGYPMRKFRRRSDRILSMAKELQ